MGSLKLLLNVFFFIFGIAYADSVISTMRYMGTEVAHARRNGLMSLSQWNRKLTTPVRAVHPVRRRAGKSAE